MIFGRFSLLYGLRGVRDAAVFCRGAISRVLLFRGVLTYARDLCASVKRAGTLPHRPRTPKGQAPQRSIAGRRHKTHYAIPRRSRENADGVHQCAEARARARVLHN